MTRPSIVIGAFALAACAPSTATVDTENAMVAWGANRACKRDDDCVMVDDCCACSAGGGRIGVSVNARTAVDARRAEACSTDDSVASPGARRVTPVTCTTVVKTDGSCAKSAHAVCSNHACRIVE